MSGGAEMKQVPPALVLTACSSPCSLQHNVIKEDGATFLAEALLTNHKLTTLQ